MALDPNQGPNTAIQSPEWKDPGHSWDRARTNPYTGTSMIPQGAAQPSNWAKSYTGSDSHVGEDMIVGKGPSYSQVNITPTSNVDGSANPLQAGQGHYQAITDSNGVNHGYVMAYQPGSVAANPLATSSGTGTVGNATTSTTQESNGSDHNQWGLAPSTPTSGAPATAGTGSAPTGTPGINLGYQWKTPGAFTQGVQNLWNHKGGDRHTLGTDFMNELKGNYHLAGAAAQDAGHIASVTGSGILHNILQPASNYIFGTHYGQSAPAPAPAPAPDMSAQPPAPDMSAMPGAGPGAPMPPGVPPLAEGQLAKMKAKFIQAKEQGATLETTMDFGHRELTLHDAMKECGIQPRDVGFNDGDEGVQEILQSISGFYNRNVTEGNFTIGGTRVKTKILKAYKNGEYEHANPADVRKVCKLVDKLDPPSSTKGALSHIKKLAGLNSTSYNMAEDPEEFNLDVMLKQLTALQNNPQAQDQLGQQLKQKFATDVAPKMQAQMPNQTVEFPGGQMNPQEMMKAILQKISQSQ